MTAEPAPSPGRQAALRIGIDLGCWLLGLVLAVAIRFGFSPTWERVRAVLLFTPLLLVLQALIGEFAGVYRRRRWDSVDELVGLTGSVLLATGIATAFNSLLEDPPIPQSVPLAGGVLALLAMLTVRSLRRVLADEQRLVDAEDVPSDGPSTTG